jgi:hypothetical protein
MDFLRLYKASYQIVEECTVFIFNCPLGGRNIDERKIDALKKFRNGVETEKGECVTYTRENARVHRIPSYP